MNDENILNHLPLVFMQWWLENAGALEISKEYIDLNTGMKSHLHLKYKDGKYFAHMRYNTVKEIETFNDLYDAIRNCEHGREFMNSNIIEVYTNGFGELDWEKFR